MTPDRWVSTSIYSWAVGESYRHGRENAREKEQIDREDARLFVMLFSRQNVGLRMQKVNCVHIHK